MTAALPFFKPRFVELLDDFSPAYTPIPACPYKEAIAQAQSELFNAQRTGDTDAARAAGGRVAKRQAAYAAHVRSTL